MYMPPSHNGDLIAYAYQIPGTPPYGSGTNIILKRISDNTVVKSWDYLGDKGRTSMSATGLAWMDLRNDTVDDKNGNSASFNSDIYYLTTVRLTLHKSADIAWKTIG